ncbi:heparan-alpha-glucosaminide N-acetyltransferase domain-containing protein [Aurantimonas endophytica]|uniref:Putative membrane protein n=1 Tax=Aurantimonas endophytica TaxID=1522175 RepID=A0A7W6HAB2_9HYPH|nr:putative membrane protein [Aurantimonas endophytica]
MSPAAGPASTGRIEIVDIARAVALLAMVVYHFTWDLEFFNYLDRGLTGEGGWRIFARVIASSFLFLVGVSLVLAHGNGVRRRPFLARLAQVAAAAAAVSVATYFATPNSFVFFGILHHIVIASLIGLVFLRLPWVFAALAATGTVALPWFVASPAFDSRWLAWTGLAESPPLSNDLVPIFPFFGAVLAGIAAARLAQAAGLFETMRRWNSSLRSLAPLGRLGRHSLLFYLVHQPVLIGIVYVFALIAPPDREAVFRSDCSRACLAQQDERFCQAYCDCAQREIVAADLFDALMAGDTDEAQMTRIRDIINECTFRTVDEIGPQ